MDHLPQCVGAVDSIALVVPVLHCHLWPPVQSFQRSVFASGAPIAAAPCGLAGYSPLIGAGWYCPPGHQIPPPPPRRPSLGCPARRSVQYVQTVAAGRLKAPRKRELANGAVLGKRAEQGAFCPPYRQSVSTSTSTSTNTSCLLF
jgi:hypothetical protein